MPLDIMSLLGLGGSQQPQQSPWAALLAGMHPGNQTGWGPPGVGVPGGAGPFSQGIPPKVAGALAPPPQGQSALMPQGAGTPGSALMSTGMMGPLAMMAAGANMMQAGGPSPMPVGWGQPLAAGLQGAVQGGLMQRQLGQQEQTHQSLMRIANKLGQTGPNPQQSGQAPPVMDTGGIGVPGMTGAFAQGIPPNLGQVAAPGSIYGSPTQNPFIQQLMRRRAGIVT